jgi:adenosylcobyric acid synthase
MGMLERIPEARGAFGIQLRNGVPVDAVDGAVSPDGVVVGTMIHGLFENARVRETLLAALRRARGWSNAATPGAATNDADEYDRLADVLRANARMDLLHEMVGL